MCCANGEGVEETRADELFDRYNPFVERFREGTGIELHLVRHSSGAPDMVEVPVNPDGKFCGLYVTSKKHSKRTVKAVAELLESYIESDSGRYEERKLEFLYETSRKIGQLLEEGEICDFLVEKAGDLFDCRRVSLMLYDEASDSLRIKSSMGLPADVVANTAVKPGESISGEVFARAQKLIVRESDPMPEKSLGLRLDGASAGFISAPLIVPRECLWDKNILGVINLTSKREGKRFNESDVRFVETLAHHTAAQIANCRLIEFEQERQRLRQNMELASNIQMSLLPVKDESLRDYQLSGICRPADSVGGDFFDYWRQGDKLCMVVGDVMGHDVGAALLAAEFRVVVRTISCQGNHTVAQVAKQANRAMFSDLERSNMLLTFCYAEINTQTNVLNICTCGHPYPLLISGKKRRWFRSGGTVSGVAADLPCDEDEAKMEKGDLLLIYSDGVIEAGVRDGRQFGRDGLLAYFESHDPVPPAEVTRDILRSVSDHIGDDRSSDDITVLALHRSVG